MKKYFKRYLQHLDYPLLFTYVALCVFGLIMIYSASIAWAINVYEVSQNHVYKRQLINLAVSVPVFLVGAIIPYQHFRRKSIMKYMLIVMFTLLVGVHLIGDEVNGAQSWILLGPLRLQPSELAKIIFILYFAAAFANKESNGTLNQVNQSVIPPITVLFLAFFLVAAEVDMGSAVILFVVSISVMFASGIRTKIFAKLFGLIVLLFLVMSPVFYVMRDRFVTEKRLARLEAFLHPFKYEQEAGFQIVNGYLAIGAGGLKGLGLGQSIQKLGYLPEPHTDFIMAIISEELGILGAFIVIGGLGFIVLRAFMISMKTTDSQARMIAAGVASLIGFQTFVNLGGLLGLIPLTGVTLPFISYGGTSIVLLSFAMGVLMNVAMFVKLENEKPV